eukprot:m.76025 g.76025  ORF g.76025 m.76025 type:complete len:1203 (+) comp14501_c0_seq2:245-3853(+)
MAAALCRVFGVKADVTNNVCFVDEQNIVYPGGANAVIYNVDQQTQRFVPGTERSTGGISAMAVSPNRRYVALAERATKPTITIYDLHSLKKRKVLTQSDSQCTEFVCIAFSPDSKYLVTQGGAPDWTLHYWTWEKSKGPEAVTRSSLQADTPVYHVSFNPQDNTHICVTGQGIFKLFRYVEGNLKQLAFTKLEPQNYLCHAWLGEDRLVAGTDTGKLLLFASGDLQAEFSISASDKEKSSSLRVECLASLLTGFICADASGSLHVFEKSDGKELYKKTREESVPPDVNGSQAVLNIAVSPSEDQVLCSTESSQLYQLQLSAATEQPTEASEVLKLLAEPFHHGPITGLDVSVRKPLVATCSLDNSVRIWNYLTNTSELVKYFAEEALCVSLHPTGLYALVGFADKLRLLTILIDDMRIVKEFNLRGCRECRFSHGGHLFAAVQNNNNIIQIFSTYSFENVGSFKGHTGKIRSVCWSSDDSRLVSCGADGAVYEWDTQSFERVGENVLKSCSYTSVMVSSAAKRTYAVGSDKSLKEMSESEITQELPTGNKTAPETVLTQVTMPSHGKLLLAGTVTGAIRLYKCPLTLPAEWTSHTGHCGSVTRACMSSDDQYLFTVGEDGVLLTFQINDKEGRAKSKDIPFAEEILITKSDLDEKNDTMSELRTRVEELKMANEYQLRLKDMNYTEKMKEQTDKFTDEMEGLKMNLQVVKSEKDKEEARHDDEVAELMDRHQREVQDLEHQHNQKLMAEYEKYQELQRRSQDMQQSYETTLAQLGESKKTALAELAEAWESKLVEKSNVLEGVSEQKSADAKEFEETRLQIEIDADREILGIKLKYEKALKEEKEENLRLKGDNGILRKKFASLQTAIDEHKQEKADMLDEQNKLHTHIKALERDIASCKKEIEERDGTIQDKEKRIFDMKKKNQELEKFKFVLDYKIKELKKQIEPRENEMKDMKVQISQMDEELQRYHSANTALELQIKELQQKLRASDLERVKGLKKVSVLQNTLTRFRADVHAAAGNLQNPKALVDSVRRLNKQHCSADIEVETGVDEDIQAEYNRQREFLERNVASLRKKLTKSEEMHKQETVKIMKENVALIQEINELRKELTGAKTEVGQLEGTLRTTKRLAVARGQLTTAELAAATGGRAGTLGASQELSQSDRIIEMQKDEIRRLRQTLEQQQREQSSRPPSSGRLPALGTPA